MEYMSVRETATRWGYQSGKSKSYARKNVY